MLRAATLSSGIAIGGVKSFSYGPTSLLVEATARQPLSWLQEFLCPSFGVGAHGPHAARVTLREDPRAFETALAAMPSSAAVELDCFVNDRHMIRLPAWESGPEVLTAFQQSLGVFYAADASARSVTILTAHGHPNARTALMRVVREVAMHRARRDGGTFLHAAALAAGGRGLLIAGEKRAGKTTLLLHLLRESGADYVSNDRVLVPAADSAALRGMPTIISLRRDSLAFFPGLETEIVTRSYYYQRTLAEAAAHRQPARAWPDGNFGVSPAQLCALLGVERRAECAPHLLLFPRITGDANAGGLRDLTRDEATARLRGALLSAGLAKHTSDLVAFADDPPVPDAEQVEESIRALAARLPAVECRIGTRSYERGVLAAECLRRLTA